MWIVRLDLKNIVAVIIIVVIIIIKQTISCRCRIYCRGRQYSRFCWSVCWRQWISGDPDSQARRPVAVSQRWFWPEDDSDTDCTERETASHAANVLRRQSATWRSDEGAARRDDWTEFASHPRLVPEQALQGQETIDFAEADPTAPSWGCMYHAFWTGL